MSRLLIRGGAVVSMDQTIGTLRTGDVLVEDDRIAQVAPRIAAGNCEVIDATDRIVLPGLIDGHRHLWYSIARGDAMDAIFADLVRGLYPMVAANFTPEDVSALTSAGIAAALDAGVTTVFDWCHVINSPEHASAAVDAHLASPIRAVFAYGPSMARKLTEQDGGEATDSWAPARALRETVLSSDSARVTMALAVQSPDVAPLETVLADIAVGRDLGVPVSMHIGTPAGPPKHSITALQEKGSLRNDLQFVHCCSSTDAEFRMLADAGARVVICPSAETLLGTGMPPTLRARRVGLLPAFGTDSILAGGSDLFEEARLGLALARSQGLAEVIGGGGQVTSSSQLGMSAHDALAAVTVDAAAACGRSGEIGSLTPGKFADLILLRASDANLWPLSRIASTIVSAAHAGNVDTVLVGGRVVKADGKVTAMDLPQVRAGLESARDRLFAQNDYAGMEPA